MDNNYEIKLENLADSFEANQEYTKKMAEFEAKIQEAMSGRGTEDTPRKNKLAALDKIFAEGVKKLEPEQLMSLFSAYRDINEPSRMIKVYNKCGNDFFTDVPMVKEQLALAYRRQGDRSTPAEKANSYKKSIKISQKLIKSGHKSGLCYENISRTNGLMARVVPNLTEEQKNAYLQESLTAAEQGFKETLEPSVGMQAVQGNLLSGNTEKAKNLANVVYLATLRDGAEESKDPFAIALSLQAACIAGKDEKTIQELATRLAQNVESKTQANSFIAEMKGIKEFFPPETLKTLNQDLVEKQDEATPLPPTKEEKEASDAAWDEEQQAKADEAGYENKDYKDNAVGDPEKSNAEKLNAVLSYSYNYRGCGSEFRGESKVGGNMAFGGQLPDHSVSRKDLDLFTGLTQMSPETLGLTPKDIRTGKESKIFEIDFTKPLTDIKDPEIFMAVTDAFVRKTFMTQDFAQSGLHMEDNAGSKDLENADGKPESLYDRTVRSSIVGAGKVIGDRNSAIDSRTNISAIFALGMGDCRHHAQAKQIMFDVWQKQEMNTQLSQMCERALSGKQNSTEEANNETAFYNVLDTQLRTADVKVLLPIEMNEWKDKYGTKHDSTYDPKYTEDHKYIQNKEGTLHNLEDHTLSWIVKKDREGKLTGFGVRDAFYQENHYDWASHDVNLDDITITENGQPNFPAGKISADKTNTGEELEVRQAPLIYNKGKRDSTVSNSMGNSVSFIGIPLEGFGSAKEFLSSIRDRAKAIATMQAVRTKATGISKEDEEREIEAAKARKAAKKNKEAYRNASNNAPPKAKNGLQAAIGNYAPAPFKPTGLHANLQAVKSNLQPVQPSKAQDIAMKKAQQKATSR